ncbi:MAG: TIGR02444 family protein [Candidatus Devosia phytovorans]|uniref:TIGR02444 family protein n=1 Tax=Candidatus Devosia phytovorans TaxID=3121372 RepID=A0AAJ5VRJ8_9HYPH|nr:TIGR02444 family protein [Devosia sp.]WEK02937.1 MAG: TIGR02444 family protein [Devosia sp.]
MTSTGFLKRLWPDMCAAYRDGDLARACLSVQEGYDLDVPLLLVLCLADRAGHLIGREALTKLIEDCDAWRGAAILPLRFARREMKGKFTDPAELGLRDDIKRLELEAERLQVLRLAETFPPARDDAESTALTYLAIRGAPALAATDFIKTFHQAYDAQVLRSMALD